MRARAASAGYTRTFPKQALLHLAFGLQGTFFCGWASPSHIAEHLRELRNQSHCKSTCSNPMKLLHPAHRAVRRGHALARSYQSDVWEPLFQDLGEVQMGEGLGVPGFFRQNPGPESHLLSQTQLTPGRDTFATKGPTSDFAASQVGEAQKSQFLSRACRPGSLCISVLRGPSR